MHAPGPSRAGVREMFDRIAPRYDLLNRILSAGLDTGWRRAVRDELPDREGLALLDVATGTGDLALALARDPRVERTVGVDIAEGMLRLAEAKAAEQGLAGALRFEPGDAQELERYAGGFDVVTIAFGIRNVADFERGLQEMAGALRPGGRLLILEFAEPRQPLFAPAYRFYRRHLLPRVGGLLSGDPDAYRYLDETIRHFPSGPAFLERMEAVGLRDCRARPLALGAVMLYVGHRPRTLGS